jgi:hypothetical protein
MRLKRASDSQLKANAKKALVETSPTTGMPTTSTTQGTPERKKMVSKWQAARPTGGSGIATSAEEAEARRQEYIYWAKWNPNRRDNARRTLKKKQ